MDKTILRAKMINQLKELSNEQKKRLETEIVKHLFTTSIWKKAKIIGITYSQSFEWDTQLIIKQAWMQNKMIAIPKVNDKVKSLTFYRINDLNELRSGYQGIFEPAINKQLKVVEKPQIDLLVVPGLYFDLAGYRIGFGGGYYDRYLIDFHNDTVSLVAKQQLVNSIAPEKHDIAVDYLITETGVLETK